MFDTWRHAAVTRYSGEIKDAKSQPIDMPAKNRTDSDKLIDFWLQAAAAS